MPNLIIRKIVKRNIFSKLFLIFIKTLKKLTYLITSATFSQYFLLNNTTAKDFHPITFPENLQLPRWMCKWKVAVYPSVFNIWEGKKVYVLKAELLSKGAEGALCKQPQNILSSILLSAPSDLKN